VRGERLRYDLAYERGSISEPYGRLPSGNEFDLNKPVGSSPYEKLKSPESLAGPARDVRKVGEQLLTTVIGLNLIGGANPATNPGSGEVLPLTVSNFDLKGRVQNWRFRAERLDLLGDHWQLVQGRFTNDPFSPAGALFSSRTAQSRQVDAESSELTLEGSRVGLSNGVGVPLPDVQRVSERQIRNNLFNVGIDGLDRNGVYIERTFDVIRSDAVTFSLTPQFLVQRTIGLLSGSNALGSGVSVSSYSPLDFFGLDTKLAYRISPSTTLSGLLSQASLDPDVFDSQTRSIVDLTQDIGDSQLLASYRYRERVYNGSLGIQTVQQSVGVQFLRNAQPIGDTGIILGTQAGYQQFLAQSDQTNLINQYSLGNNLVLVNRALLAGSVAYPIALWRGEALPATPEAGLKYASSPVVPQFTFTPGLQGQLGSYSSGETQNFWGFSANVGLTLGHFSQDFFDYTNLSLGYTKAFVSGLSPLLFDRIVDSEVASLTLEQQVYGPWVIGFGGALNVITANPFNLTGSLSYRQRAYDISLSYNFSQQLGVLSIRLNDFNWFGPGEPLELPPT
jgi:hypothetical protein